MFGAFELALPSGLQQRLSTRRRQGLRRRVRHGPGRRHHRRALHRPGAGVAACLRRHDPLGDAWAAACSLPTRSGWACSSSPSPRSRSRCRSRAPGWRRSRASSACVMIVAALYFLRNVVPPLAALRQTVARCWLVGNVVAIAVGVVARRRPPVVSRRARDQAAQGARASPSIVVGCFGVIACMLAPKEARARRRSTWIHGERRASPRRKRAASARRCSTSTPTGACPAKSSSSRPSRTPRSRARFRRFTLVKVDCTSDDDPEVVAAKKRYGADTLPTLVLLTRRRNVAHKIDHFIGPSELLALLRGL